MHLFIVNILQVMDNCLLMNMDAARDDQLNLLIAEIKSLMKALDLFGKFHNEKDLPALEIARDAIIFRAMNIQNRITSDHQMTFPTAELINLLNQPKFLEANDALTKLHEIADFPIASLHKFALSELLRSSLAE